MKCRYSENDVALFVEGDLGQAKAHDMEAHIVVCDACRTLAEELRESQSLFKSLKQDTVSAAALSSVRSRVLAEAGAGKARVAWGRWVYALAGAGFVVAMCAGLLWHAHVKIDPRPPMAAVPATRGTLTISDSKPEVVEVVKAKVPLTKRDERERRQPRAQEVAHTEIPPEPPKQLVVKLLTDDPNIVIYWLVDQNGGTL
jgi:anti-sigma factor RsiW